ncbi:zinc ribbon domain-containing protein [Ahrensia kielensis]
MFSGLMTCGQCGGRFTKVNKHSLGCSTARNKGKACCTNMAMI